MKVLITAGPTREPIDEVRFISNRSSGRMGFALADAAAKAGHDVTLLLGPVLAPTTLGDRVNVLRFQTTAELQALLEEHFPACDQLIMAAAVADYRVANFTEGKTERKKHLKIELEGTPDLVAGIAKTKSDDQQVIAFALEEPHELEARAVAKMKRKGVDAIVANPLVTMEGDSVNAILLHADGQREQPDGGSAMTKEAFAGWLIDRLSAR
ncbi:phosphopantothenoylcysteine decarboxylase domain-containing protein [Algisphaera agarilytica]|uniref:Phosphopantothenoylcysteine decarboxylase/phosphopantothenate--cysteine ligase n=1 Tax=Algisphaera agarilytica TaxID=1385975 RepID=A0A7X0H669_9BACT|nr:phosphopantothenoylcysteine decarboxylase [Algisphaera agarilytica]MBB6429979.1 phosphopantothenoylcysteine decarboxylase/phosphopantothenate--cysteine ligase [Algisphaera agarilytica]